MTRTPQPIMCGICEKEIRPGDQVQFVGLAPSERGNRRIVIVDDPDRMAVVHATCFEGVDE